MDVISKIKELRLSKGISQADMARTLDMSYEGYHRLEKRGGNNINLEQLIPIAKKLGIELSELLIGVNTGHNEELQVENDKLREEIERLKIELSDLKSENKQFAKYITEQNHMMEETTVDAYLATVKWSLFLKAFANNSKIKKALETFQNDADMKEILELTEQSFRARLPSNILKSRKDAKKQENDQS